MNPALLLHWHYVIFLAPSIVSALLLIFSSVRLGHHTRGHAGRSAAPSARHSAGHVRSHAGSGSGSKHARSAAHGAKPAAKQAAGRHASKQSAQAPHGHTGRSLKEVAAALTGIDRAPLPLVLQAFGLVWGVSGCLANQALLPGIAEPTAAQLAPVLAIAGASGIIGARIAAEIIARALPQEETLAISRESLYGLTGKVAYPVSETSGRVMLYDDHGSLHDETCRVTPGSTAIERGRTVMVMDRDPKGYLIVEEIVE